MAINILNTWFYNTNLKNYPELQETLTSEKPSKFAVKNQLLSGAVGIGKTHNSILIARDYILTKENWHYSYEPFFISFVDYIKTLNNLKFGSEEDKTQSYYKLKELEESPFLIFDDLRCKFTSEYEKTMLDNALLDLLSIFWANRKNLTIIITSNNTDIEIKKAYSEAVCSRLFGLCEYVAIKGEDKRIKARLDNM